MLFNTTFKAALAAAFLLFAGAATAQSGATPTPPNVNDLRRQANQAYQSKDWAAFRQAAETLHRLRPYNDEYMSLVVLAAALVGDRTAAYEMMLNMQQQGLAHDFSTTEDTQAIRGTQAFDYVNDLLVRAAKPVGSAEPVTELPEAILLPTGIAWDASRQAWLVSDAREGAIWSVDADGDAERLLSANEDNGLQSLYGLLIDADNNRLWVSSSPSRVLKGFDAQAAEPAELVEFTLDGLERIERHPVPVDGKPHRLGELVRTPGGDIYTVDTILPLIYRLKAGEDELKPYLGARDLVSLRGIALSDDGNMLYVADYEMGITGIDIAASEAFPLTGPATLNLGGIQGLFFWDGHLVVIQNGITPQRIMRLGLADDGRSIDAVAPLAVALPMFDKPDFGAMRGDDLVFFANSHWVADPREQPPVKIARVSIAEAPDLQTPEIEKFWDDYRAAQQAEDAPEPAGQEQD